MEGSMVVVVLVDCRGGGRYHGFEKVVSEIIHFPWPAFGRRMNCVQRLYFIFPRILCVSIPMKCLV